MPDLRTDWLTARTVLIAENRALRPNEFASFPAEPASGEPASLGLSLSKSAGGPTRAATSCPFCPGHESQTPPAEYEQLDGSNHWRLRIIPNKFPAVSLVATDSPSTDCISAVCAHEVIIESARHIDRTSQLSQLELSDVFRAYAHRLRHWRNDSRLAYGLIFKNQGPRAGASLSHLHSQLLALPAVPPAVDAELIRANDSFAQHGSCAYCRLIEQERTSGARIIYDRDGFFAFCPFASVQPHEVWLLPTNHEPSFELSASADKLQRLSKLLHPLIARMESLVPDASFNLLLRTAPWKTESDHCLHWRIELLPRVNAIAGFEVATGLYINPIPPERAASNLRLS